MYAASSIVVQGLIFCISATPHLGSLFPLFHELGPLLWFWKHHETSFPALLGSCRCSAPLYYNLGVQVCRIVWGLLYDRFGYRSCIIFIGTCITLGVSGLPLLEYLGELVLWLDISSSSLRRCRGWQSGGHHPLGRHHDRSLLGSARNIRGQWNIV